MSLQGKRVVVTRAEHQAGKLAQMLVARGAQPILFPCIDISTPDDTTLLDDALRRITTFDWLLLTSTNTVVALQRQLEHLAVPLDALAGMQVAAVGTKTARAATKYLEVTASVVPDEQTAEGLAAAMPDVANQRILLPQSNIARTVLADLLNKAGAEVTSVVAYRTVTGIGGVSLKDVRGADGLTFTSPSTVKGFVERMSGLLELPVACIGPITEKVALEAGFTHVVTPSQEYNLAAMLDVLEQSLLEKTH